MSRRAGRRGNRRGFTLVEILVVIAIMAVIVGALGWGSAFFRNDSRLTPDEKAVNALRRARDLALQNASEVQVIPAPKPAADGSVSLELWISGKVAERVNVGDSSAVKVRFLSPEQEGRYLTMIGGVVQENGPAGRATFFSDGTCRPFRLQVTVGTDSRTTEIDPWTCAPVLPTPTPR